MIDGAKAGRGRRIPYGRGLHAGHEAGRLAAAAGPDGTETQDVTWKAPPAPTPSSRTSKNRAFAIRVMARDAPHPR